MVTILNIASYKCYRKRLIVESASEALGAHKQLPSSLLARAHKSERDMGQELRGAQGSHVGRKGPVAPTLSPGIELQLEAPGQ